MSSRLIARRYAKALLDLAVKQDIMVPVQQELERIQAVVRSHADLERLVSAPLISPARKAAAFDAVLAAGKASPLVRQFFQVVAQAARLYLFHDIVAAFHERVDIRLGIVVAQVTTTQPLSPEQAARLSDGLARRTGRTVRLSFRQDSALIGGLAVQVGSTIYDASLRGQLAQLKTRFLSA